MSSVYINGRFRTADNTEPVLEAATGELLGQGPARQPGMSTKQWWPRGRRYPVGGPPRRATREDPVGFRRRTTTPRPQHRRTGDARTGCRSRCLRGPTAPSALLRYYAPDHHDTAGRSSPSMVGHGRSPRAVGMVPAGAVELSASAGRIQVRAGVGGGVLWSSRPRSEQLWMPSSSPKRRRHAGLPPGTLNVIPGGAAAGAHLVSHPGWTR